MKVKNSWFDDDGNVVHRFINHDKSCIILPELTRVEFIGEEREFVRYAQEGCRFDVSIQDDGRTIKIFEVK